MYRYFLEMTKVLSNNSLAMYFEKMRGKLYIFPFFFTINIFILVNKLQMNLKSIII